jgi:hypothetical protein
MRFCTSEIPHQFGVLGQRRQTPNSLHDVTSYFSGTELTSHKILAYLLLIRSEDGPEGVEIRPWVRQCRFCASFPIGATVLFTFTASAQNVSGAGQPPNQRISRDITWRNSAREKYRLPRSADIKNAWNNIYIPHDILWPET